MIGTGVNFINWLQKFGELSPLKNWGPKTCKISVDFTQPPTLIANISGTAQGIQNPKTNWSNWPSLASAHRDWEGVPQKNCNRENLKFGLKFSVLGWITSGLLGVSSRTFFQSTCRVSGMINWVQFLEGPPHKFTRAKKPSKILRDFWQLSILIANISGKDPHIKNRKSSLSTTTPPTLGQKISCTLVHKWKSYWA